MQAAHSHDHEHEHTPSAPAQAWVKTGLLLGLALYFLYNIVSGNLTNYINIRFSWLAYIAVAIFGALGAVSAYDLLRARRAEQAHDDHDHYHNHDHVSWPVLFITAIPLLLGTLIPSQPLGASAIDGNISTNVVAVSSMSTLGSDPLQWNVLDWLRAFNKSTNLAEFNNQPADVIGFVYREPDFAEDTFMVARFTISCCVADANAIGLPVVWPDNVALDDSQWVRVSGTFTLGAFRGQQIPLLVATAVEIVEQPKHPYLYP
ncbi:MAG: TIGR03943 family protein [Chloroflexi bacterium]|nr:TIGR03943 family protein [Chloroflexota bacterium]